MKKGRRAGSAGAFPRERAILMGTTARGGRATRTSCPPRLQATYLLADGIERKRNQLPSDREPGWRPPR